MEFNAYESYMQFVVIIIPKFLHGEFDVIVLRVLEIFDDILFFVRIHHFVYKLVDIQLCPAIYNSFNLF